MARHRFAAGLGAAAMLLTAAVPALGTARWFHSPSGNLSCEVTDHDSVRGNHAYCQSARTPVSATLTPKGSIKICRGERCLGNGPEDATTLGYGHAIVVGRFRCTSRVDGIRCRVHATGRGYLISSSGVRVLPKLR